MGMVMGMRVIRPDLEGWQLDLAGVRSRMYLAPTPRERERWHALWLPCRGLTASSTAERTPHPKLKTSLTRSRSHQDLPARLLLPNPPAGHSPEQVARTFMPAIDTRWYSFTPPHLLTFREKVLTNWPAEMSHSTYGECDFDAQRTDETQDPQQPAG